MQELTLLDLENCFNEAKEKGYKYVAVLVTVPNCSMPELIINHKDNFDSKLDYYKGAYNEDLTLKSFNKIKILDFAYGETLGQFQYNPFLQ